MGDSALRFGQADQNGSVKTMGELKPFIVTVEEVLSRRVIVWAEDRYDAEDTAYDFCNDNVINLTYDDFSSRSCICDGEARESALEFYEQYGIEYPEGV